MAIELKLNQMRVSNGDGTFDPIIAAGPEGQRGQQGAQGNPGSPGQNGVSPTVTITAITDGHRVTITDVNGSQSFDVMDGEDAGGSAITVDSALSSTSENPVQNKVVKAALDGKGTYSKPSGGIPASDLASAVQTSLGKADTALQSVPSTYRTAAAQDVIDAQKVNTSDYNPDSKTAAMTQSVGVDANGKLWTAPGSGGDKLTLLESIEITEPVANIYKTFAPCKRVVLELTNLSQNNTSNSAVVLWITFNNNGYLASKAISLHQTTSSAQGVVYGTQYECIAVIDTNVFGSLVSCEAFGKFGTGNGFLNGDTLKSSNVGNNISSVFMYLPSVDIAAGLKMNIWGELA